jgi:hypothetical protein
MNMTAEQLYPREYSHFPELEGRDLQLVDSHFVLTLQWFRNKTKIPMLLSPAEEALARRDYGAVNSRHYAVDRLCDAGDFFPQPSQFFDCWFSAIHCGKFGGVGIYADTTLHGEKRPLLHLDTRPKNLAVPAMWARDRGVYHGIGSMGFYKTLEKIKKMIDKQQSE